MPEKALSAEQPRCSLRIPRPTHYSNTSWESYEKRTVQWVPAPTAPSYAAYVIQFALTGRWSNQSSYPYELSSLKANSFATRNTFQAMKESSWLPLQDILSPREYFRFLSLPFERETLAEQKVTKTQRWVHVKVDPILCCVGCDQGNNGVLEDRSDAGLNRD